MRGPIDYLAVEFIENQFKGEVLDALNDAVNKGIINVLDIALIHKDNEGNLISMELSNMDNEVTRAVDELHKKNAGFISLEDQEEIGEGLEVNNSAGLLIIEHLWAKDLKKALLNANTRLISEGRIHPDAAAELDEEEEN